MKEKIYYKIRRNSKAKRLRITIKNNGEVFVTVPKTFFNVEKVAENFIQEKSHWILNKLKFIVSNTVSNKNTKLQIKGNYKKDKEKTLELVKNRIVFFNKENFFEYNKITIRNQKTRWGSCSKKKNLNFNYRILYLTPKQQDYIIIHEMCHLRELNHSSRFWKLVENFESDYKKIKKELNGLVF